MSEERGQTTTDPWQRTQDLRRRYLAWLGDRRVGIPLLLLVASHLTPLLVVLFHPLMSLGVQNILFFWPQYGLYPYLFYYRILGEGGYGSNPLGVSGFITSGVHWLAVLWITWRLTQQRAVWTALCVFVAVASVSLTALHIFLPLVGFTLQLDGP